MQFAGIFGIQIPTGLIGKHDFRIVDQSPRHRRALLLSPAQLGRLVIEAIGKSQHAQQRNRLLLHFPGRPFADVSGDADIFQGGKFGEKIVELKNKSDVLIPESRQLIAFHGKKILVLEPDRSAVRLVEGTQNMQERALTGARGPDNRNDFTLLNADVDTFQYLQGAEGFSYI